MQARRLMINAGLATDMTQHAMLLDAFNLCGTPNIPIIVRLQSMLQRSFADAGTAADSECSASHRHEAAREAAGRL